MVKLSEVTLVAGFVMLVPFVVKVGLKALDKAVELVNLYIGILMHAPVITLAWTGIALIVLSGLGGAMAAEGHYHDHGRPPMY